MNLEAVAERALLCWLAFPAIAVPVSLVAARYGRPGFLARLVPWFVVIPTALGASYAGRWPFFWLLTGCAAVACLEIARLGPTTHGRVRVRFAVCLAAAVPSLAWAQLAASDQAAASAQALIAVAAAGLALSPVVRASAWTPPLLGLSLGAALSFWLRIQALPLGFRWVLFAFSIVVIHDMMAFAIGQAIGGPRAFPRLSPRKTVAGYFGGTAGAVLVAFVLSFAVPELDARGLLAAGLLGAASAAAGDLFASAVKRRHGVKDFGSLLGPQGGMLDRLDSLAGAGWVLYFLLRFVEGG